MEPGSMPRWSILLTRKEQLSQTHLGPAEQSKACVACPRELIAADLLVAD